MADEILDNQEQEKKAPKKVAKKATPKKKEKELLPTKTLSEIQSIETPEEEENKVEEQPVIEEVKPKTIEELEASMNVVDMSVKQSNEPVLSRGAKGWADWLAYVRMTPQELLAKYPNHKMRHLIEEIIEKTSNKTPES